jgi:hypothetical protein
MCKYHAITNTQVRWIQMAMFGPLGQICIVSWGMNLTIILMPLHRKSPAWKTFKLLLEAFVIVLLWTKKEICGLGETIALPN